MAPDAGSTAASLPDTAEAQACASALVDAFADYNDEFRSITRRAPARFDNRDWAGVQADVVERLDLYRRCVSSTANSLRDRLGPRATDVALWRAIKAGFVSRIDGRPDAEFHKTFFSSVTRRLFGTVGVNPDIEFFALDIDPLRDVTTSVVTNRYVNRGDVLLTIEELLSDFRAKTPWRDFDGSVEHVATDLHLKLHAIRERRQVREFEVIQPVFYQMTRAYLVGRVMGDGWQLPMAIALKNSERGLLVDAVMLDEDGVSILFSFTRSYFHVDLDRVGEAVLFLKQLLPRKPVSELFTVLGRAKQGKTERFREIFRRLEETDDQFVHAPGERGLVMACFLLDNYDVVFKIIRDRFPAVKTVLREEVIAKYDLVFKHDRAGRLVDAQEFRRVRLPKARFAQPLLDELLTETANTVKVDGDDLVIDHLYIERRMTPLNLYLRSASKEEAELAVIDYGQAIRDLAHTNIFAGDLLLKNFGVTRHGRVIFYDYDELCRVTDCRFREVPQASSYEDEMRAETWYHVNDNDVFPETFINFLGFNPHLKQVFLDHHQNLLTADWWRELQQKLSAGQVIEVLPYQSYRVRVASSY